VHAGHHIIKTRKHGIGEIERAIGEYVALGALEDMDALEPGVERIKFPCAAPGRARE